MKYIVLVWIKESGVLLSYAGKNTQTKKDMFSEELAFSKQMTKQEAKEVYKNLPNNESFCAAVINWTNFNSQYPIGIGLTWLRRNNVCP